ncbi:hypothetical protein FRC08_016378, partial [Ceratobasidium sp. 394]
MLASTGRYKWHLHFFSCCRQARPRFLCGRTNPALLYKLRSAIMVLRHPSVDFIAEKNERIEEIEHAGPAQARSKPRTEAHGDAALAILGTPEVAQDIAPEQDAAVLRKVDKWLIPVMLMVYFIQQLDKLGTTPLQERN